MRPTKALPPTKITSYGTTLYLVFRPDGKPVYVSVPE